jgi:copper chaperone CopZ
MKDETLRIEGLHCDHCTALVKRSIEITKGVDKVDVTLKSVCVSYDESKTRREDIVSAITRFGYKVLD